MYPQLVIWLAYCNCMRPHVYMRLQEPPLINLSSDMCHLLQSYRKVLWLHKSTAESWLIGKNGCHDFPHRGSHTAFQEPWMANLPSYTEMQVCELYYCIIKQIPHSEVWFSCQRHNMRYLVILLGKLLLRTKPHVAAGARTGPSPRQWPHEIAGDFTVYRQSRAATGCPHVGVASSATQPPHVASPFFS